jgi:hypothetical protein
MRRLLFAACFIGNFGCMTSYALMQTAHTQPPMKARWKFGMANVQNAIDDRGGRDLLTDTTPEPGLRLGVAPFMDMGLSPFMGTGASIDAKANLLNNHWRAAFAPRLLAGYAYGLERDVYSVEVANALPLVAATAMG